MKENRKSWPPVGKLESGWIRPVGLWPIFWYFYRFHYVVHGSVHISLRRSLSCVVVIHPHHRYAGLGSIPAFEVSFFLTRFYWERLNLSLSKTLTTNFSNSSVKVVHRKSKSIRKSPKYAVFENFCRFRSYGRRPEIKLPIAKPTSNSFFSGSIYP